MTEEEVQTALSCEEDDPPTLNAKMYVERGAQTIFSYDPDLSNTAIRVELRTKDPKHDTTVASDTIIEPAVDDGSGSSVQTDLSYATAEESLDVPTENEEGDEAPNNTSQEMVGCTEVGSNVSFYDGSQRGSIEPDEGTNISDPQFTADDEGTNSSDPQFTADGQDKEEGVSIQTGMVLGTGTVAPNASGGEEVTSADEKWKTAAVQTKFGGYPVDQSDTRIIEELQSGFPVHSQDAVVEPQVAGEEGDDSMPPPSEDEGAAVPDESGEQQPEPESTVPEENTDGAEEQNDDAINSDENTEEKTKDADEGAEPASTGNGVDSGAQTVFTYDPFLSNSQLVDELANAYPKHSTENAVVVEDGAIPSSRTESRESFQSAVTSQQNLEDADQGQAVDEAGGEEQVAITDEEAQTGIVCGVGNTSPENTSENVDIDLRSKNVQTVFGGYNVDQSDTKIVEELQFKDPVHSQRASLETVEEIGSNPTEDTSAEEEPVVVDVEDTNVESAVETSQDESDIQVVEDTAEGDVPLDAGDESSPKEEVDENQGETEENGEIMSDEEIKEGDEENAIQESKTETAETADLDGDDGTAVQTMLTCASIETAETDDLDGDDGTAVQTMLTCASDEEYPSKAIRYVEHCTQTVFSYDPDLSNTQILTELKTKAPEHEDAMASVNEEDEPLPTVEEADTPDEAESSPTADEVEGGEAELAAEDEADTPDEAESSPTADEVEGGEAEPATEDEADEATPDSPEDTDGTETGENKEQPEIDPGEGNVETGVTETESSQFNENIQTDITCGVGSSTQLGSNNDKTQQTFFTYDSNVSNSQVIPELQSGHPIHSQLAVENAATMAEECRGPCSKYAKEGGGGGSEGEDNCDVEPELPIQSKIGASKSLTLPDTERDDSTSRPRAISYPPDKNEAERVRIEFTKQVGVEEETNDGERQDTAAQTQIIFGTGTSQHGINEKASNTYFTYDATQSDTQILDELKTRQPVHSGEAVSFITEDKEPVGSDDSLFNDDWEKNESSGEGEVEVQDINATHSKASDWLAGQSDGEVSDTEGENEDGTQEIDVQLTLVVESEEFEEEDGKQQTVIQTDLSFGDTLEPLPVAQQNTESSLSVHIMFNLQVGNSTNTMQMKVPKTDLDPNDPAFAATFNVEFAGGGLDEIQSSDKEANERIRCTLPILVTVTCESRTDDSGREILEPVVDLIFQKPPSNLMPALEYQPEVEQGIAPDDTTSQSNVDELYNDPLVPSEDKREMEIQTDLVLGALLFSESISSVGGEEGFDTASEGPVHDEELFLPSPPLDEPCSVTNVSWEGGSLDDADDGPEVYDDLHLRVNPNDVCNQQYVQQLVPSSKSQEHCPISATSTTRTLMKVTTAELLFVPDKVSSLAARNTEDKRVHVTNVKLHRWGFAHESNPSNVTVIPESFEVTLPKPSTSSGLDSPKKIFSGTDYGVKSLNETTSGRVLTAVATRIIFEFQTSEEDVLSDDGRAQAVKSKIAFQILGSRDADNKSIHVATLDLKECIAPSKVTFMANGELTSKVLLPEGSPLELPIEGDEPLVLKLSLPQPRHLDESPSTATGIRKVPFTIAQVGDETLTTTKDLQLGGSSLQFTVPLGDGCGTMIVTAKVEENSTDEESPEVITMTTTFVEADIQEADMEKEDMQEAPTEDGTAPAGKVCVCRKKPGKAAAASSENDVPVEESGKSKTITAMFIKDGVPGEKQTKVLRPGGSPMYVNLMSSNGVPVRAKLALAPQPDDEVPRTTSESGELKTKVSCKIIQDGVETETKTKLMEAGGSPLRFDLPIGPDGFLTANVIIPQTDDDVCGESPGQSGAAAVNLTEECVCDTVGPCECESEEEVEADTPKQETRPQSASGDRCFDVITEALATYAREIDPLRKALEEITEKVKELNVPEFAGIGEPPSMSYHSLDEFDDRQILGIRELMPPPALPPPPPPPVSYQHKITLQTGMSRVSTTIHSARPNARQKRPATSPSSQRQQCWEMGMQRGQQYPMDVVACQREYQRGPVQMPTCPLYQNPTSYSLPESPQGRCPLARPPDQYQCEQMYMQQQQQQQQPPQQQHRSSCTASGGYMEQQPPQQQQHRSSCTASGGYMEQQQQQLPQQQHRSSCTASGGYMQQQQQQQQLPQQQQHRSSCTASGGYMERPPPNRCPYRVDNPNVQPPQHMAQNQAYGQPNLQDPRYFDVGLRLSQPPSYQYPMQGYPTTPNRVYDDYAPPAVNIQSRVYVSSDGLRSGEQDPRNGPRSCNPDIGYDDYGPQQRSPIAEMYIKLSQNSRSSQLYEEDGDSLYYDDEDDERGYSGYQRRGNKIPSQKMIGYRGSTEDDRRQGKPRANSKGCVCSSVSATEVTTQTDLEKKDSYWCDPEDVTGSTKPGSLGNKSATPSVN